MNNPSLEQLGTYLAKNKGRGQMTLKLLGKLNPFIVAMETAGGQQILQDDIDRHEELLIKVYNEDINSMELAEFRY